MGHRVILRHLIGLPPFRPAYLNSVGDIRISVPCLYCSEPQTPRYLNALNLFAWMTARVDRSHLPLAVPRLSTQNPYAMLTFCLGDQQPDALQGLPESL